MHGCLGGYLWLFPFKAHILIFWVEEVCEAWGLTHDVLCMLDTLHARFQYIFGFSVTVSYRLTPYDSHMRSCS